MKSAVYTKAGQVGLAEIDRPQIEAQDDAFVVPTFGVTVIQKSKKGIVIVATKLLGSSKKSEKLLQRLSQETLSLRLSPMVVGSVTPVVLALMVLVTITRETTGLVAYRLSISVSILLIGPLSRFQVNHLIIQKACLSHF